jgi:selenocysteine-specific elongation factor
LGAKEAVGPKESAYCQIVTTEPVLAVRGDRFVIRDETSSRTIGGGVIVHPWAVKHKKQEPGLPERLEMLHRADDAAATAAFLSESLDFAVSIDLLQEFLNLDEDAVRRAVAAAEGVRALTFEGERLYTTDSKWHGVREELLQRLKEFHAAHPLAQGLDMEEAREKLSYSISPRLFRGVIEQFEKDKALGRDGNVLKLPTHRVRLDDREQTLARKIASLLGADPLAPPDLKQIETETRLDRRRLAEMMRLMERDRSVVRVSTEMYFLAESIDKLKKELCEYLSANGQVTPAGFRDRFGTTRKYTIPLLEYFDRDGVTIRVGDVRRLRRAPAGERK